jgi:TatA/E family protein of Tat protein translocase
MNFMGIGPWEVLLILLIALIIFGPGKLPEIAGKIGKGIRVLKKASTDFRVAIDRETNPLRNPLSEHPPYNSELDDATRTEGEEPPQHSHEPG